MEGINIKCENKTTFLNLVEELKNLGFIWASYQSPKTDWNKGYRILKTNYSKEKNQIGGIENWRANGKEFTSTEKFLEAAKKIIQPYKRGDWVWIEKIETPCQILKIVNTAFIFKCSDSTESRLFCNSKILRKAQIEEINVNEYYIDINTNKPFDKQYYLNLKIQKNESDLFRENKSISRKITRKPIQISKHTIFVKCKSRYKPNTIKVGRSKAIIRQGKIKSQFLTS